MPAQVFPYPAWRQCPGFVAHYLVKRETRQPTYCLQFRLRHELHRLAEAEIGDGHYARREAQQFRQGAGMYDADPADADAFSASGQPQVLDRANGAVEIHVRLAGSTQDHRPEALAVASHAYIEVRLED